MIESIKPRVTKKEESVFPPFMIKLFSPNIHIEGIQIAPGDIVVFKGAFFRKKVFWDILLIRLHKRSESIFQRISEQFPPKRKTEVDEYAT